MEETSSLKEYWDYFSTMKTAEQKGEKKKAKEIAKNLKDGLDNALIAEGLNWTELYSLWGRAYFAPDGTVDHYFYAWLGQSQATDEWEAQFREVLERFLATYRFEYPMNRRFAQCGGVTLRPAE